MVGEDDQITIQNNYIYRTAGRSPALSEDTLLHAVNNVWEDNNGHAIEGGSDKARGIFEGNVFINVRQLVSGYAAREVNLLEASEGDWDKFTDTSFFSENSEYEIAPAASAKEAKKSVPANSGAGKIDTTVGSNAVSDGSVAGSADSNTSSPEPAATNEAAKPRVLCSLKRFVVKICPAEL
ncbi:hypothetical protein ACHAP5_009187 [Fusarium lateritium]